jgi:hypothetical protein
VDRVEGTWSICFADDDSDVDHPQFPLLDVPGSVVTAAHEERGIHVVADKTATSAEEVVCVEYTQVSVIVAQDHAEP